MSASYRAARPHSGSRPQGLALVVALVLLLVMTMIAVIAMRTTTLDLKMTTNTALSRRAFEASESIRVLVGPLIFSMADTKGWPVALGGTEANSGFPPLDPHITLVNPTVAPSNPNNADLVADLDTGGSARLAAPDIRYQPDLNGNGVIDPEDIHVDIWITKTGTVTGSPRTGGGTGTVSFEMYEVRSQSRGAGNAAIKTGSTFRVKAN